MTRIPTWQVRLYGTPRGAKPWLCRIESSPTKMPCVYACVKNIRKVSRTVWMHFERGMVPVDIRQKFTLHSRKKNDPNSRSLTLSFLSPPPSRDGCCCRRRRRQLCCCVKDTTVRCGRVFGLKRLYFLTIHFSTSVLGPSHRMGRSKDVRPRVYLCDWLAKCPSISNQSNSIIPCPFKWE
jgi:hypothetical protein